MRLSGVATTLSPDMRVCGVGADARETLLGLSDRSPSERAELRDEDRNRFLVRVFGDDPKESCSLRLDVIPSKYCHQDAPNCIECPIRRLCLYGSRRQHVDTERPRLVDLFSGAGGLSLGFEQAGFQTSRAIDNDVWSVLTFAWNRPENADGFVICGDVGDHERHWSDLPATDVLVGGVPCQSFSTANRQRRDEDPRHHLFHELFRVADLLNPKVILIENVSGFRAVTPYVLEQFAIRQFAATQFQIDARDFGIPQRRRRVFLVGFSRLHFPDAAGRVQGFLADLKSRRSACQPNLWDAIGDLPPLAPVTIANRPDFESDATGQALRMHDLSRASPYVRAINSGRVQTLLYNHKARYNNDRDIEIFGRLKPGENSLSEAIQDIMPYQTRNHIFVDKYFRLEPDQPSRTITAHMRFDCNTYIHPFQSRGLTVREAARLQGFPDDYAFVGTFQRLYQQVGNAVPPPFAKQLATSLLALL